MAGHIPFGKGDAWLRAMRSIGLPSTRTDGPTPLPCGADSRGTRPRSAPSSGVPSGEREGRVLTTRAGLGGGIGDCRGLPAVCRALCRVRPVWGDFEGCSGGAQGAEPGASPLRAESLRGPTWRDIGDTRTRPSSSNRPWEKRCVSIQQRSALGRTPRRSTTFSRAEVSGRPTREVAPSSRVSGPSARRKDARVAHHYDEAVREHADP